MDYSVITMKKKYTELKSYYWVTYTLDGYYVDRNFKTLKAAENHAAKMEARGIDDVSLEISVVIENGQ